jgi:5-methylcytosine-specific restriction endonuclease McrA
MEALVLFLAIIVAFWFKSLPFQYRRQRRKEYYSEYLKSDDWTCQYCGAKATEVHHKRYAKNIGREPIKWLVSLCRECHRNQH